MKNSINVVGAAIVKNGMLLALRRADGNEEVIHKFEFVGGKIEEGETLIITGSAIGNVASLTLPESCYINPGRFALAIKANSGSTRHTIYVANGKIHRASTNSFIDPGHVIPDINQLLSMIATLEQATNDAKSVVIPAQNATNAANNAAASANEARDAANLAASNANDSAQTAKDAAQTANNAASSATTAASKANAAAETATTLANEAVEKANAAAASVNEAKNNAFEAAKSATNAAEDANKAASDANSAADSANKAATNANAAVTGAVAAATNANEAATIARKWGNVVITVTMLPNGSNPICKLTDTVNGKTMAFELPIGPTGLTPNITIGKVETGLPGTQVEATFTGTRENPVLNLKIPRGDTGEIENFPYATNIPLPSRIEGSVGTSDRVAREDHIHEVPEVGGVNLYTGTRDFSGSKWLNRNYWTDNGETFLGLKVLSKDANWAGLCQNQTLYPGEKYCYSAWIRTQKGNRVCFIVEDLNTINVIPPPTISFVTPANGSTNGFIWTHDEDTWVRVKGYFEVNKENEGAIIFRIRFEKTNKEGTMSICGIKLERGAVPTDWSPAPEDLVSPVTSVNGQTGNVVIDIPEAPVTSVNGQTGNVVIDIPEVPVKSVNGQTGDVIVDIPTYFGAKNYIIPSRRFEEEGTYSQVSGNWRWVEFEFQYDDILRDIALTDYKSSYVFSCDLKLNSGKFTRITTRLEVNYEGSGKDWTAIDEDRQDLVDFDSIESEYRRFSVRGTFDYQPYLEQYNKFRIRFISYSSASFSISIKHALFQLGTIETRWEDTEQNFVTQNELDERLEGFDIPESPVTSVNGQTGNVVIDIPNYLGTRNYLEKGFDYPVSKLLTVSSSNTAWAAFPFSSEAFPILKECGLSIPFVFSIDLKMGSGIQENDLLVRFGYYKNNKWSDYSKTRVMVEANALPSEYKRYTIVDTLSLKGVESNFENLRIRFQSGTSSSNSYSFWVRHAKFQVGQVETDWSPSVDRDRDLDISYESYSGGIYDPVDLTVRHAEEIAEYEDPWAWIKSRITSVDYSGIHVGDYIPFECTNGTKLSAQIAGIDTYYRFGQTGSVVPHHIDFICRELWPNLVSLNSAAYNNGTTDDEAPYLNTIAYFYINSLKGYVVPNNFGSGSLAVPTSVDYTNDGIYYFLPDDLKNNILSKHAYIPLRYNKDGPVNTDTGGGFRDLGPLWIPDEFEISGNSSVNNSRYAFGGSVHYPLFNSISSRIKSTNLTGRGAWWTSSPVSNATGSFVSVQNTGLVTGYSVTNELYVPVCFRIG